MLPNPHFASLAFDPAPLAALTRPALLGFAAIWIALMFHELGHAAAAPMPSVSGSGVSVSASALPSGAAGSASARVHLALFPLARRCPPPGRGCVRDRLS